MKRGGFLVDQIIDNKVIQDYDYSYSPKEIKEVVCKYFTIENAKELTGTYNNIRFKIYAKNITYLGNPWEPYKKRIQLGSNFKETVINNIHNKIVTILLGVYHYNDLLLFTEFDAESYANGKSNNSAAHVQTYDLQRAIDDGIYSKIDRNDHKITVFTTQNIDKFMKMKFMQSEDPLSKVKQIFSSFYASLPKKWNGVDCYKEMLEALYKDRRQTEWAGFYHEYRFSSYLEQNPSLKETVIFQADKTKNGIDLDLYYPKLKSYGDLKAHTIGDAILGNSYETLEQALESGPLYYVICEHTTRKDKEMAYRTLHYWHNFIREESKRTHDPMRQKNRMKGEVSLVDFVILRIDKYNYKYLSSFQKDFVNSNGKPRKEKFEISEKDISNFIIYKENLSV